MAPFGRDSSFNVHALPISGTRDYGTEGHKASEQGLKKYYKDILYPALMVKPVARIVLVDHSGGGGSVDGFRQAFLAMVRAGQPDSLESLTNIEMVLINVIDEGRKQGGSNPVEDPKTVRVLIKIYLPGEGYLDTIVVGKAHPRVTPDYPPGKWEIPFDKAWKTGEEKAALQLVNSVVDYNKKNGGLVTEKDAPAKPKKKTSPWWVKFAQYTRTR
ncbi:hypothetical protein MMC30_004832 [Trapelia coarctata]|nr:hypothetical protein [Trapelia coarctata]